MIVIPKGNLMRVAASKGHDTFSALKEKTGVDRKTLRAIEAGRPVKETTLQSIANKLRVPMAHLVGSSVVEGHDVVHPRDDQHREFKLQRLDAAALRKLAGENNDINWIIKFDQISEDLEKLLQRLRESLNGWFFQRDFLDDEAGDNLTIQIAHIKRSVEIDKSVEELEQRDFKILGGTYVTWDSNLRVWDAPKQGRIPVFRYISQLVVALAIVPKTDNNSTVRVFIGPEPPQEFREDQLEGIDFVFVDGDLRWSRRKEFSAEEQELMRFERLQAL
jgi:transcriptional regulator with XRE-family HTH domain